MASVKQTLDTVLGPRDNQRGLEVNGDEQHSQTWWREELGKYSTD